MTELQLIHHAEQMEALRADFQKYFQRERDRYKADNRTDSEIAWVERLWWAAFLREKGLSNPTNGEPSSNERD